MTDSSFESAIAPKPTRNGLRARAMGVPAIILVAIIAVCAATLENRFTGLEVDHTTVADTPVTLYKLAEAPPLPPVIVAHGFGGSRQMMDQIAVSIARQGFVVASVDLPGHGRNGAKLSPDITNIDGTTADLVDVIARVADEVVARPDTAGPVSYVGHSMATDVVIRAAQSRDDVGGVVAISMFSPAVTETEPKALLVVTGATESHLRAAGLEAAQLVDSTAREGETVSQDGILRRTAVAPFVGHVGVLYAPSALDEVTSWLSLATGTGESAARDRTGWIAGVLLVSLVILAWPLSKVLPKRPDITVPTISKRTFLTCLLAPFPFVLAIGLTPVFGILGHAAFGTLCALFAVWGAVQLYILARAGVRIEKPDALGVISYIAMAAVFAAALDRYGAAFIPSGNRTIIACALLFGTAPFMLAETLLTYKTPLIRRILARVAVLFALITAMALAPLELGLTFTVIPVLVLFFVVFGSMARWIAARRGPAAAAVGQALVLAWAIAASTPLFAVAGT